MTEDDGTDPTYPTHYTIALYSKQGRSEYVTDARHVNDELRKIGLEWKTADWAHKQQVVIAINPIIPELPAADGAAANVEDPPPDLDDIMEQVRERVAPAAKKVAKSLAEYLLK